MIFEKLSDQLSLPKDICLGASVFHVIGQYEIYIENYKCIIEYNESLIKIQSRTCKIIISGKRLHIEYFNNDDMKIRGRIQEISFVS